MDTFKSILATSRVILELNPFGILIRGPIHIRRPMVRCALKNYGWSNTYEYVLMQELEIVKKLVRWKGYHKVDNLTSKVTYSKSMLADDRSFCCTL